MSKDLSGIHFLVVNNVTGKPKPITSAFISTDESEDILPVNNRGVLNLIMKVGVHSITFTSPGFAP